MKQYLVLAMRRPEFDPAVVEPHLAYIAGLRARGQLECSGGFSDKSGGAYILLADNLAEAQAITAQDPVLTSGSSDITVYEWNAH